MSEWRPIDTAPEEGVFLVYMPEANPGKRMQVARWHKNVKVVGHVFSFDLPRITHWMPLPEDPMEAPE